MVKLRDLQPVREMPVTLVQIPSFLTLNFSEDFPELYSQATQGNTYLEKLKKNGGSSPLIIGLVNKVLADNGNKFRTPTPTDNIYLEHGIFSMIKGKHYTNLNALDVWQWTDNSYNDNKEIWEQLVDLAKTERVTTFPFRVQGFYCIPDKSEPTYNVRVEPADNFRVIQDDKLNYSGRFSQLDEYGICIPDLNGRFIKYTLGQGVSGVVLNRGGVLDCDNDYLVSSGERGRVVVIDAKGIV